MIKKVWMVSGIAVMLGVVAIATVIFRGKVNERPIDTKPVHISTPSVIGDSVITITYQGNTARIVPKQSFKERTPFYLESGNVWGEKFYYMVYHSEQQSLFYSFDTVQEDVKLINQKIFTVKGNVDSGEIVNEGKGLLYRELKDDSYVDGALKYLKKDGSQVTIVKQCIYYSVSPDKKRVLAGGNAPDVSGQTEKQFYLYNFVDDKITVLNSVFCPQSLEELIGVQVSWNQNSRYLSLIDKVMDVGANGKIKKDFANGDAVVTMFRWSPDGQKLAFLSQSSQNANYSLDLENSSFCLSEQIGVYNTWDGSIKYLNIQEGLALEFLWGDDSKSLVVKVVPPSKLDAFISSYQPDNSHPGEHPAEFNLMTVDLNAMTIKTAFRDFPVQNLDKYYDDKLLVTQSKKGQMVITVHDLKTKTSRDLLASTVVAPYSFGDQVLLAVTDGVYALGPNTKLTRLLKWDQVYPLALIPEHQMIAYTANDRIEVVSLKPQQP